MKQKGFTLIELIAMIVILAVIMILSFSSLTGTLKKTKLKEEQDFKDKIINAATIYVETNINNFSALSSIGGSVDVEATTLIQEGYILNDISNPTYCSLSNIYIEVVKQSNKTLSYLFSCKVDEEGNEMPMQDGNVIYYDPINNDFCSNYHEDNSLITYNGNNPTGSQTSCLKWYVFNDDSSATNYKLLLDHNITAYTIYNVAISDLTALNSIWNSTARLISLEEIAEIVGIEWNGTNFYFTGLGTSADPNCTVGSISECKFGWLYDRTSVDCELTGCNNNTNQYTGEAYPPQGYWTSTTYINSSNYKYGVFYQGRIAHHSKSNRVTLGLRPVIEAPKQ